LLLNLLKIIAGGVLLLAIVRLVQPEEKQRMLFGKYTPAFSSQPIRRNELNNIYLFM